MPRAAGWALTMMFVMITWVLLRVPTFDAALRVYEALFGFGDPGHVIKWRTIAVAALVAVVGPPAWALVHRIAPYRWIAMVLATVFVIVLFKIGNDANYEFIYFQF